jgi:hypothetical protein
VLIENMTGLIAVRRRTVALRCGDAVRKPLLSGVVFGLVAGGPLTGEPQVDDLGHAFSALLSGPKSIVANCADTVAGCVV